MEISKQTTRIIAHVLIEFGPFGIQRDFEVETRDAKAIFDDHEEVLSVSFFDVQELTIDGVRYCSEPVNHSETFGRDGVVLMDEKTGEPAPDSFFAEGSAAIN